MAIELSKVSNQLNKVDIETNKMAIDTNIVINENQQKTKLIKYTNI